MASLVNQNLRLLLSHNHHASLARVLHTSIVSCNDSKDKVTAFKSTQGNVAPAPGKQNRENLYHLGNSR